MSIPTPPRNLINEPDLQSFVEGLVVRTKDHKNAVHIKKWLTGYFHNWARRGLPAKIVMNRRDLSKPSSIVQSVLTTGKTPFHPSNIEKLEREVHLLTVTPDTPDWLLKAFKEETPVFWLCLPKAKSRNSQLDWLYHVFDFMDTLPSREIKHTMLSLEASVKAWDAKLARQKLLAGLVEGTETVGQITLAGTQYDLVKLVSRENFKAEGAVMHNCVAGYFGRRSSVYSVRPVGMLDLDDGRPFLTVEVKAKALVQVRGLKNERPGLEVLAELGMGLKELSVISSTKKAQSVLRRIERDEDEDEDEAWDDGDEDEDEEERPKKFDDPKWVLE